MVNFFCRLYFCKEEWARLPGMALSIKLSKSGKAVTLEPFLLSSLNSKKPVVADIFEVCIVHVEKKIRPLKELITYLSFFFRLLTNSFSLDCATKS